MTMRPPLRFLRAAATVELGSLVVLLANLATEHWPVVSSLVGAIHGCAYLLVIITVVGEATAARRARLVALLPGIGGLLALRQLTASLDPHARERFHGTPVSRPGVGRPGQPPRRPPRSRDD